VTVQSPPVLFSSIPARRDPARATTAVATLLLAVASTIALGAALVEYAVPAIAVLTPIVVIGTLALVRR
jgi:hypothetical protein